MLPETKSKKGRLAAIRLARAADAYFRADLPATEREALATLELARRLPLASWLLANSLVLRKEHSRAAKYWPDAARLPGPLGNEARPFTERSK
ncbi:MAG: hypothetical protein ACAH95_09485 [Fimbriimonas sp.]